VSTPRDLIVAWHDAVRDRDVDAVTALVHADVEIGGPKGSGHGVDLMTEWVQNSGIGLEIESIQHRGPTFVVGQAATWPDPDAENGRTGRSPSSRYSSSAERGSPKCCASTTWMPPTMPPDSEPPATSTVIRISRAHPSHELHPMAVLPLRTPARPVVCFASDCPTATTLGWPPATPLPAWCWATHDSRAQQPRNTTRRGRRRWS